jgi:preprotein translocase subunit SecE
MAFGFIRGGLLASQLVTNRHEFRPRQETCDSKDQRRDSKIRRCIQKIRSSTRKIKQFIQKIRGETQKITRCIQKIRSSTRKIRQFIQKIKGETQKITRCIQKIRSSTRKIRQFIQKIRGETQKIRRFTRKIRRSHHLSRPAVSFSSEHPCTERTSVFRRLLARPSRKPLSGDGEGDAGGRFTMERRALEVARCRGVATHHRACRTERGSRWSCDTKLFGFERAATRSGRTGVRTGGGSAQVQGSIHSEANCQFVFRASRRTSIAQLS